MLKDRRKLPLRLLALALAMGAAACADSPTGTELPYSVNQPRTLVAMTETTSSTALADTTATAGDRDTTDLFPNCDVSGSRCPGTGTATITEPGGTTTKLRTLGADAKKDITVGTTKWTFELAIWDNGSATGGDFIGVIYKDGKFVGYFGYCVYIDGVNSQYTTKDAAGNVYIHWENTHADTTKKDMYHYIFDPQKNVLKIYHKKTDGTTVLVYQGPPITHAKNLPPPDPASGAGPYTEEKQFDRTGTMTSTTTPTTPTTTTPTTTSPTPTSPTPTSPPPTTTSDTTATTLNGTYSYSTRTY